MDSYRQSLRKAIYSFVVMAAVILCPCTVLALDVTTNLTADATWTTNDSPVSILVDTFTIATNATLIIEPGVAVKIKWKFEVEGQIRALGTENERITFDELNPGDKWGHLYFRKNGDEAYRTNVFQFADLKNMNSYIYISEQGVSFSNCTIAISNDASYGICGYVNQSSGNPARFSMVGNNVSITSTRDDSDASFGGIMLDGFPSEFRDNTFAITATGRLSVVYGFKLYKSNTTAFESDFLGNTISVSNLNESIIQTHGIYYDSSGSGTISNNTLSVVGPTTIYGIQKYDSSPIVDNRISIVSALSGSFGYVYGVYVTCASAGEDDLMVNNEVDVSSGSDSRFLYGLYCYSGMIRGNRVRITHTGASSQMLGVCQVYYDGVINANTVWLSGTDITYVRGIDLSTHNNTSAVVTVRNNIVYGDGSVGNKSGIYKDSGCQAVVSNSHNLVYNFTTNYCGLAVGVGAVTEDPLFADTNLHLSAGSPAVDAGTNQAWMAATTDMDGQARIYNECVDIGADEYGNNPVTVTMTSSAPDPTRNTPIPVTVVFSEEVSGFTNTDITPGNGTVDGFTTVSASNYTFSLTPTNQGLIFADIPAGAALGGGSNGNAAADQFSRMYDTVVPSVAMNSAAPDPARDSPIPVTVVFSENVLGFTNTDISAGNASVEDFLTVSASNYTFNLAPSGQGEVTADIAADVAQDASGNGNTAAARFSRIYEVPASTNEPAPAEEEDDEAGSTNDPPAVEEAEIATPSDVSASDGEYTDRIRVTWSAVADATGYEIWRSTASDSSSAGKLGETSDTSLADGSDSSHCLVTSKGRDAPPGSPTGSSLRGRASSSLSQEVQFPEGPSYDDMSAAVGQEYYYWVKAVNAIGTSEFSASDSGWRRSAASTDNADSDMDDDDLVDVTVYHKETGYWYTLLSAGGEVSAQKFGAPGYVPVPGDYDGDAKTDLAVYHESSGYWYVLPSSTYTLAYQKFGEPGYAPVPGDYDGDGLTDLAVYHESSGYWYILTSSAWSLAYQKFGEPGYSPTPADYDGDGRTDLAVYHEASGYWFILTSSAWSLAYQKFGEPGYAPVPGDYDADGSADLAVYHESSGYWFMLLSASGVLGYQQFGQTGFEPAPGDYDGDGRIDPAVYDESSGYWYVSLSQSGTIESLLFGGPGYTPVGAMR